MRFRLLAALVSVVLLVAVASGVIEGSSSLQRSRPSSPEEDEVRIQQILDHWIEALGGEAKLKTLRTVEMEQLLDITPNGNSGMIFHTIETADGRFRYDLTSGDTSVGGFDGTRAWHQSSQFGFGYVSPNEFTTLLWRAPQLQALTLSAVLPTRTLLKEAIISNRRCAVIGMRGPSHVLEKWFFDLATGQLLRVERPLFSTMVPANPTLRIDFSDFRNVSGINLPFLVKQSTGYQSTVSRRLDITLNGAVDASSFAPNSAQMKEADLVEKILSHYTTATEKASSDRRIHTRVTQSQMDAFPAGITTQVKFSQKGPQLLLREEEMAGTGKVLTGYDGTTGWVDSEIQGFRVLKGADLTQFLTAAEFQGPQALDVQFPLRKYLGRHELNGRPIHQLALSTLNYPGGVYSFDVEKGVLVHIETQYHVNAQTLVPTTVDYEDFRVIDGVNVPFRTTWTMPTKKFVMTCKSIALDVPLDDSFFKPRHDD